MGLGEGVGASQWRTYVGLGYGGIPPEPEPERAQVVVPVILERIEKAAKDGPLAELIDNRIVIREQVFFREGEGGDLAGFRAGASRGHSSLERQPGHRAPAR